MPTTSVNDPDQQAALSTAPKLKLTTAVIAAILLAVVVLLGITYLMYRGTPTQDTPGEIDNARGVTPQYPPATPAEPTPAEREAR
jgi:hypothetical protein